MLRSTILIIAIIASGLLAQVPANITGADMREAAASSRAATEVPRMSNPPADSSVVVEAMPRIITFIKARYPDNLKGKGIAGPVVLDLLISEKGTVDSAAVVKGLSPALDSSALLALRSSVFSPAMVGGKPTAVLLRYAYRFLPEDAIDLNVRREDSAMGGKRGSPENASDASGLTARLEGALRYDIGPGELGSVAGFDGDGIKSLQAFPAIGRPFIAGYNFSARGSDYGDTKFLVDGIKLPSLIHNVASFSAAFSRPMRWRARRSIREDGARSSEMHSGAWWR
jgi:TonB family protein